LGVEKKMRQAQLKKVDGQVETYQVAYIDPKKVKQGTIKIDGVVWTVVELYKSWE